MAEINRYTKIQYVKAAVAAFVTGTFSSLGGRVTPQPLPQGCPARGPWPLKEGGSVMYASHGDRTVVVSHVGGHPTVLDVAGDVPSQQVAAQALTRFAADVRVAQESRALLVLPFTGKSHFAGSSNIAVLAALLGIPVSWVDPPKHAEPHNPFFHMEEDVARTLRVARGRVQYALAFHASWVLDTRRAEAGVTDKGVVRGCHVVLAVEDTLQDDGSIRRVITKAWLPAPWRTSEGVPRRGDDEAYAPMACAAFIAGVAGVDLRDPMITLHRATPEALEVGAVYPDEAWWGHAAHAEAGWCPPLHAAARVDWGDDVPAAAAPTHAVDWDDADYAPAFVTHDSPAVPATEGVVVAAATAAVEALPGAHTIGEHVLAKGKSKGKGKKGKAGVEAAPVAATVTAEAVVAATSELEALTTSAPERIGDVEVTT